MRNSWEIHEKIMRNSWEIHEKIMRKSWERYEKVMRKSWESYETAMRKFTTLLQLQTLQTFLCHNTRAYFSGKGQGKKIKLGYQSGGSKTTRDCYKRGYPSIFRVPFLGCDQWLPVPTARSVPDFTRQRRGSWIQNWTRSPTLMKWVFKTNSILLNY